LELTNGQANVGIKLFLLILTGKVYNQYFTSKCSMLYNLYLSSSI